MPDLLARVEQGEEIIIARGGNAVAKLVPVPRERRRRVLGTFKGRVRIAEDFGAPLSDHILDDFERLRALLDTHVLSSTPKWP